MPFISAEEAKAIRTLIKKELKDFKFSITVRHNSSLDIVILSGPLFVDLDGNEYMNVNECYYKEHYKENEEALNFLNKLFELISSKKPVKESSYDMDYGSIPNYYLNVSFGKWNKPYNSTVKPELILVEEKEEKEDLTISSYLEEKMQSKFFSRKFYKIAVAYADCLSSSITVLEHEERNLDFFCKDSLTAQELKTVTPLIIEGGYNNFNSEKSINNIIEFFGENAQYFFAREGSPCFYIKPSSKNIWINRDNKINCDEFSFDGELGLFRVWFD